MAWSSRQCPIRTAQLSGLDSESEAWEALIPSLQLWMTLDNERRLLVWDF